jgi:crossover junction endodeoxyribonuclease RusA
VEWLLRLPFTAPLSLNDRMHYMVKAKHTKAWRDAARLAAEAAGIPSCSRIRITLIYTPRDRRRRDPLNLIATLKACEDGIVDAGVVPDDTPAYVESQMPLIDLPDGKDAHLSLLVERVY